MALLLEIWGFDKPARMAVVVSKVLFSLCCHPAEKSHLFLLNFVFLLSAVGWINISLLEMNKLVSTVVKKNIPKI